MDGQPTWAPDLPAELYHKILLAARDGLTHAQWCRLVAVCASVSTHTRRALTGEQAAPLWQNVEQIELRSSWLSLNVPLRLTDRLWSALGLRSSGIARARGLNCLQTSHAHHAHTVMLVGGGWHVADLMEVCASVADSRQKLVLSGIHDPAEGALLSTALSSCPAAEVSYSGSVPCALPGAASTAKIHLQTEHPPSSEWRWSQWHYQQAARTGTQQLSACLRPLTGLRHLDICVAFWVIGDAEIELLVAQTQLQSLALTLLCWAVPLNRHAMDRLLLQLPASLQLTLRVHAVAGAGLGMLLLSVMRGQRDYVALHTLEVNLFTDNCLSGGLDETILSVCRVSHQLIVRSVGDTFRLKRPAAAASVVYLPLVVSEGAA